MGFRAGHFVALALGTALLLPAGQLAHAAQEESFEARLERAIAAMDSAEVERAVDLLRTLLSWVGPSTPRLALARAHLHLAAASLSLGLRDSAVAHLREMIRANPFAVPDTSVFNPEVISQYRIARRTTPALDFRIARDTVLRPQSDKYLVAVAVGQPREVRFALLGPGGSPTVVVEETRAVDSMATVPLAPRGADSLPLFPGGYRLVLSAGSDLEVSTSLQVMRVSVAVDTLAHEPPLAPARFHPETRKGPPATWSSLLGLMLGGLAAALPSLLSHSDLPSAGIDIGSLSVGGAIATAGIVGTFVGRRPVPIPENIERNRALRASWAERNREIAAENERRRRWAPSGSGSSSHETSSDRGTDCDARSTASAGAERGIVLGGAGLSGSGSRGL